MREVKTEALLWEDLAGNLESSSLNSITTKVASTCYGGPGNRASCSTRGTLWLSSLITLRALPKLAPLITTWGVSAFQCVVLFRWGFRVTGFPMVKFFLSSSSQSPGVHTHSYCWSLIRWLCTLDWVISLTIMWTSMTGAENLNEYKCNIFFIYKYQHHVKTNTNYVLAYWFIQYIWVVFCFLFVIIYFTVFL